MFRSLFSISILGVASILASIAGAALQVILARSFSLVEYGYFSSAYALVVLLAPFSVFGISKLWLRLFARDGWFALDYIYPSIKIIMFLTSLMLVGLLIFLCFGTFSNQYKIILIGMSFYILYYVANETVSSLLQLEHNFIGVAFWQLMHSLPKLLIAIVMVYYFSVYDIFYVVIAFSCLYVFLFFYAPLKIFFVTRGDFKLKGHVKESCEIRRHRKISVREIISGAWPYGVASVMYLIYFQSDILLINYFKGSEAVAVYNVVFVIISGTYLLPRVIYQKYLLPKVNLWFYSDKYKLREVFFIGVKSMAGIGLLLSTALFFLSDNIVAFLFGDKYIESAKVLSLMALCIPVRFVASSLGSLLVSEDLVKKKVKFMSYAAVTNLILNLIMIPFWGVYGAAISTVMSEIFIFIMYLYAVKKYGVLRAV